MRWFEANVPIRLKPPVPFGMLWGLGASLSVASVLFGGSAVLVIGAVVTLISGIACIAFREAIAAAYVAAVARLEAPAVGDAASNIGFCGYAGCVGHAGARNRPVASKGCSVCREEDTEGDT